MEEILTPVNDGQASDEGLQTQVETSETVNADSADVATGGEQDTEKENTQNTTEEEQEKAPQSKEENALFAKVRREAEAKIKAEYEQRQAARDAEFAQLAAQNGWVDLNGEPIKTEKQYWETVKAQAKMEALINGGKDPEAARAIIERDELQNRLAEIERAAREQEKKQAEINEFVEFYREVNGKDFSESDEIPKEVFITANEKGISLKYAYAEYVAKSIREKEKSLALGKQTAEVNAKNSISTAGSVSGTGATEPEFYTREQVAAMSPAEVHKHFEKIEASMKRWT